MNTPFFITGLPRSRTAWLANFMTWGGSFCHHDLVRLGVSVESVKKHLEATRTQFVGDSDSGLVAIAPGLVQEFPNARWVLVRRPVEDAVAGYQRAFEKQPYPGIPLMDTEQARSVFRWCHERCIALTSVVPSECLLVVDHTELDTMDGLRRVWEWCLPLPFPSERAAMLDTFRVTIIANKVHAPGLAGLNA